MQVGKLALARRPGEQQPGTIALEIYATPILLPIAVARGIKAIAFGRRPFARCRWRRRNFRRRRCVRRVLVAVVFRHDASSRKTKSGLSHRTIACAAAPLLT